MKYEEKHNGKLVLTLQEIDKLLFKKDNGRVKEKGKCIRAFDIYQLDIVVPYKSQYNCFREETPLII